MVRERWNLSLTHINVVFFCHVKVKGEVRSEERREQIYKCLVFIPPKSMFSLSVFCDESLQTAVELLLLWCVVCSADQTSSEERREEQMSPQLGQHSSQNVEWAPAWWGESRSSFLHLVFHPHLSRCILHHPHSLLLLLRQDLFLYILSSL